MIEERQNLGPGRLIRAIWFVVIGWWLSLIWLELAWLIGLTIILLPISFFMFSKVAFAHSAPDLSPAFGGLRLRG